MADPITNVETLMTRFTKLSAKQVDTLGRTFVNRLVTLKNAFVAARAAPLGAWAR